MCAYSIILHSGRLVQVRVIYRLLFFYISHPEKLESSLVVQFLQSVLQISDVGQEIIDCVF